MAINYNVGIKLNDLISITSYSQLQNPYQTFNSASTLQGYIVSPILLPNTIPVIFDQNNSPILTNPLGTVCANYYVSSTFISNPAPYSLLYNTTDNNLYTYINNTWANLSWQNLIQNTPEYQNGSLSINSSGELFITPKLGSNLWYQCYPLFGANTIYIQSIDNTNYTIKYYLPPDINAVITNANHLPVVFNWDNSPQFKHTFICSYSSGTYGVNFSNLGSIYYFAPGNGPVLYGFAIYGLQNNYILTNNGFANNIASYATNGASGTSYFIIGSPTLTTTQITSSSSAYWFGTYITNGNTIYTMNTSSLSRIS